MTIKKGEKVMYSGCGMHCKEQFIFKALERKQQIKIICPTCGSETHIRHVANGKIRRQWYKGDYK